MEGKIFNHPEYIETNSSLILFLRDEAFKIIKEEKGPEYSNLASRYDWLCEEMRINAEITPSVYLDIRSLVMEQERIVVKEKDVLVKVAEYCLHMKRLSQKFLVRNILIDGTYSNRHSDIIARKIAKFHLLKLSGQFVADDQNLIDEFSNFESFKRTIENDFGMFEAKKGLFIPIMISESKYQKIKRYILNFLEENKDLLMNRFTEGYVVPIHGDFHSLNIFVENDFIYAIDRVLRRHLRVSDIIKDPAYLGVDLEVFGFEQEKKCFLDAYKEEVGDPKFEALLPFYSCRLGFVGGMVNIHRENTILSKQYFDLAYKYVRI
ncbi:MAG: hypothetical protein HQ538_05415 [Parcubacteria group bacterium]|nr:hypothetical protein [Parcubacteria group bacterium]